VPSSKQTWSRRPYRTIRVRACVHEVELSWTCILIWLLTIQHPPRNKLLIEPSARERRVDLHILLTPACRPSMQ